MHGLVLAAAGSSTRFGARTSKVLRHIVGVPVLVHAAAPFGAALCPLAIVIAVRPEDRRAVSALARTVPALKGAILVLGGATRQESVANALRALPENVDLVFVHDAARPLVTTDLVERVAEAAARDGAAAPALPLVDSVHRVDAAGRLVAAVPRDALRSVQTPQAARGPLLARAFALAEERGTAATDEVGLLIAAGIPVTAVAGDPENVKITSPADMEWAERVMRRRGAPAGV